MSETDRSTVASFALPDLPKEAHDDRSWHQSFQPDRRLKMIVGDGGMDKRKIADADSKVAEIGSRYHEQAGMQIKKLEDILKRGEARGELLPVEVENMRALAFDIKSSAGTFGYGLLTDVMARLVGFLEGMQTVSGAKGFKAVHAHIDAAAGIAANRMAGDGGVIGQELCRELERLGAAGR
jgi:hypothetical protein